MTRFSDWFSLSVLVCFFCIAFGRALILYSRGIRVVVVDWQRTGAQVLADLALFVCLALWVYEVVAVTWPLQSHIVPKLFRGQVIDVIVVKVLGMGLMLAGLAIYVLSIHTLGKSWRIGIDRKTPGNLVTSGIFAAMRNPVYVALDLLTFGAFFVLGRLVLLVLASIIAVMLHYQIRREERALTRIYGAEYSDYSKRVGRYGKLPKIS